MKEINGVAHYNGFEATLNASELGSLLNKAASHYANDAERLAVKLTKIKDAPKAAIELDEQDVPRNADEDDLRPKRVIDYLTRKHDWAAGLADRMSFMAIHLDPKGLYVLDHEDVDVLLRHATFDRYYH